MSENLSKFRQIIIRDLNALNAILWAKDFYDERVKKAIRCAVHAIELDRCPCCGEKLLLQEELSMTRNEAYMYLHERTKDLYERSKILMALKLLYNDPYEDDLK